MSGGGAVVGGGGVFVRGGGVDGGEGGVIVGRGGRRREAVVFADDGAPPCVKNAPAFGRTPKT